MKVVDLPLHTGSVPYWLLKRMKDLARSIITVIIDEFGEREFIRRISNPIFFQSFSNVLGFDWDSSGSTTVLTGVLKSVLNEGEFGVKIAGGKGLNALKTPEEIRSLSLELGIDPERLVRISRLTAKVDNSLIQDGYDIYHHVIIFSRKYWTVIQQGMNTRIKMARRYHWDVFGGDVRIENPHSGIVTRRIEDYVMNIASRKSREAREVMIDVVRDGTFRRDYRKLISMVKKEERFVIPRKIDWNLIERLYEIQPKSFEDLLLIRGFGKGLIRALALISDIIYNVEFDKQDPAKYCLALGGKDGVPFPISRRLYDEVLEFMKSVIEQSRLNSFERRKILLRLRSLI